MVFRFIPKTSEERIGKSRFHVTFNPQNKKEQEVINHLKMITSIEGEYFSRVSGAMTNPGHFELVLLADKEITIETIGQMLLRMRTDMKENNALRAAS